MNKNVDKLPEIIKNMQGINKGTLEIENLMQNLSASAKNNLENNNEIAYKNSEIINMFKTVKGISVENDKNIESMVGFSKYINKEIQSLNNKVSKFKT